VHKLIEIENISLFTEIIEKKSVEEILEKFMVEKIHKVVGNLNYKLKEKCKQICGSVNQ
jgi:hypothetical protein